MSNFTTSRKRVSDLMALSISEGMLPWRADFNRAGAVPINADTEEPYKLDSAMLLSFFKSLYNYTDNRWISQKQAEKNGLKIPKNAQGFVIDFFSVKDKKSGMYIDFDKYMKNVQDGIIDYLGKTEFSVDSKTIQKALKVYEYFKKEKRYETLIFYVELIFSLFEQTNDEKSEFLFIKNEKNIIKSLYNSLGQLI